MDGRNWGDSVDDTSVADEFTRIWTFFRKSWRWLLLAPPLSAPAAYLLTRCLPPRYQASARLLAAPSPGRSERRKFYRSA